MASAETGHEGAAGHRISDLVERTGVSKELIHHYLRQGLLPRPEAPASYSDDQVRLLRVIRTLREEHHLPLDDIRSVVEAFDFRVDHLEAILLGEGVASRLRRFAAEGSLAPSQTLSVEEMARHAGVSTERLGEHVAQGVVTPLPGPAGAAERWSERDAVTVALCERGVALGLPFESFRTVASYVRVAFELEHGELFDVAEPTHHGDAAALLRDLFVRREVVGAFVQSVYGALIDHHIHTALGRAAEARRERPLDRVVFRPSPAFLKRHGVLDRIEATRRRLGRRARDRAAWLEAAELQLHAGYDREAVFFLEQALDRWPGDPAFQTQLGIALVLTGDRPRALELLSEVAEGPEATPVARIYLALSRWSGWPRKDLAASREATAVVDLVDRALAEAGPEGSVRVRLFGAWLLTALPPAFRRLEQGRSLLLETLEALHRHGPATGHLPGLRERYLANAAFLTFECLRREPPEEEPGTAPSLEVLRAIICRLDPSSAFAEEAFLAEA